MLWYVRTLDVGTHVAHPALPTFLHLLHDDALQLSVCQRLPRLEPQVVGSEFRHLLHCVIAHFITAQEKFLDTSHDALLLVHLRDGLAFVVLLIRIAEGLADEVDAKRLEHAVPRGSHHAALLRQMGHRTIICQQLQAMLCLTFALVDSLRKTGLKLKVDTFQVLEVRIPDDGAVIIGLRTLVWLKRICRLADYRQGMCIRVIIQLRVMTHPATPDESLLANQQIAPDKRRVETGGTLVSLLHKLLIIIGIRPVVVTLHDNFQRHATHAGKGQQRELYLLHTALHLLHLSQSFGTRDVQHHQARERLRMVETSLAEGGSEHQVRQFV